MTNIVIFDPTIADKQSNVRGVGRYLQILKENLPDVTFTDKIKSIPYESVLVNPFFNIISPSSIGGRKAKKQVAVIHDLIPLKYPNHFPLGLRGNYYVFLNKFLLGNYDFFVTDSEVSKNDIVSILKIPHEKIKVIYPTAPSLFFEKKQDIQFEPPIESYCLYVGDATWNKNLVTLARAIKKINVSAIFVGRVFQNTSSVFRHPWQKELADFMKEVEGDKRFIFPGFIEDYKLVNLYDRSKCNVLLSRDEGFGFSYLESAILGTPSVLSDIPIFKETAQDSALFADPQNVDDIANKIGEFYFKPDSRKSYSAKAIYRSEFFSKSKFKKEWESVLTL